MKRTIHQHQPPRSRIDNRLVVGELEPSRGDVSKRGNRFTRLENSPVDGALVPGTSQQIPVLPEEVTIPPPPSPRHGNPLAGHPLALRG